jgi:hypothetical protein
MQRLSVNSQNWKTSLGNDRNRAEAHPLQRWVQAVGSAKGLPAVLCRGLNVIETDTQERFIGLGQRHIVRFGVILHSAMRLVRRSAHRRTRNALVGRSEREDAQLLGIPRVHRPACHDRRRVRSLGRRTVGSVDFPGMSAVWFDGANHTTQGHVDLRMRLRGARGPRSLRDVPQATGYGSTADGTACMPQVGQPRLVGDITLSSSQRGAYEPASCLRGDR